MSLPKKLTNHIISLLLHSHPAADDEPWPSAPEAGDLVAGVPQSPTTLVDPSWWSPAALVALFGRHQAFAQRLCVALVGRRWSSAVRETFSTPCARAADRVRRAIFVAHMLLAVVTKVHHRNSTPLFGVLVSLLLLTYGAPEPLWRLLQALGVAVARPTAVAQIARASIHARPPLADGRYVAVVDNLDVAARVWSERGGRQLSMLHFVVRAVVTLPPQHAGWLVGVGVLSTPLAESDDANVCACDRASVRDEAFAAGAAALESGGRLGYRARSDGEDGSDDGGGGGGGSSSSSSSSSSNDNNRTSQLHVLPPSNHGTMTWEDGYKILEAARTRFGSCDGGLRTVAPLVVDGQLYLLLWRVRTSSASLAQRFRGVSLLPGLFHFQLHVVRALFRLYGDWLLRWAHRGPLGRPATAWVDDAGQGFAKADRLLETVATAVFLWSVAVFGEHHEPRQAIADAAAVGDRVVCELLSFLYGSALPYFHLRSVCRGGWKNSSSARLLAFWLPHFFATKKSNYVALVALHCRTMASLDGDVADLCDNHCLGASLTGHRNTEQPLDLVCERVSGARDARARAHLISLIITLSSSSQYALTARFHLSLCSLADQLHVEGWSAACASFFRRARVVRGHAQRRASAAPTCCRVPARCSAHRLGSRAAWLRRGGRRPRANALRRRVER